MKPSEIRIPRACPGCQRLRGVRESDWKKRKTDYCLPCTNRSRVGLDLTQDESGKGTRLYTIWRGLRQRCGLYSGGHERDLERYRERGISVCDEWAGAFMPFHDWAVSQGYEATLILDRINNDGPYEPGNCRWVTVADSNRNKSSVLTPAETNLALAMLMNGCSTKATALTINMSTSTVRGLRGKYLSARRIGS